MELGVGWVERSMKMNVQHPTSNIESKTNWEAGMLESLEAGKQGAWRRMGKLELTIEY